MDGDKNTPVHNQLEKAKKVWAKRSRWDKYIKEAYDFALPNRQNLRDGSFNTYDHITDMTAQIGMAHFAGNLQKDLFPPASSKFTNMVGPWLKSKLPANEVIVLEKEVQNVAKQVDPFFQTGDFDTAANEACSDLAIGTGAIMPVKGDHHQPVFFANVPFESLATSADSYGRNNYISWKQTLTLEEIHAGFIDTGKFSEEYLEAERARPNEDIELYQDFIKVKTGWKWVVYTNKYCDDFIIDQPSRTCPIAVMRYYRGPGEAYGRGPLLQGLATIKTLNKAQELALRSAAVNLLGMWAYRAGGTFNPETVNIGAGEFWPMMSTGGAFGPDVTRLDTNVRADVAHMVIDGMRDDVKKLLLDTRIEQVGKTPPSAQQIVANLQERADANIGAYGRLSREGIPVLAPRATEILFEAGIVKSPMQIEELLVTTKPRSPMQQALDARQLESSITYVDIVAQLVGPENIDEYAKPEVILKDARYVLDIDEDKVPSNEERLATQNQKAEAAQAQAAMMMAQEAAKSAPPPTPPGVMA